MGGGVDHSAAMTEPTAPARKAVLHRMATGQHVCPYGTRALHLLKRQGYEVDDHLLTTPEEIARFKADQGVRTTPQAFIGTERIGGYEDLRRHFGMPVPDPDKTSYGPVIAVFAAAAAIAMAAGEVAFGSPMHPRTWEWIIASAMVILAMLKLQDLDRFATMFVGYDLLAARWVPYAFLYPFLEFTAGTLMIAHAVDWLSIPIALTIGTIGAASVIKAVYIQKRELRCACVGGGSRVPLGVVSLAENLAMVGMALWMLFQQF